MVNVFLSAIRFLIPGIPVWSAQILVDLLKAVVWAVQQLEDLGDLKGKDKLVKAVQLAGEFADRAFDEVPAWSALAEDQRDRILTGAVEGILFFIRAGDDYEEPKGNYKRKISKARRHVLSADLAAKPAKRKVTAKRKPAKK